MLLTLLLFNDNSSLEVEIVLLLQDVEERWICATIDANLLELIPEMILDRLLLKAVPLKDDVVLAFEHEAVDDEVLFFEQICLLQEADNFLSINIVITFLNVHRHKIQWRLIDLLPLLLKFLIFLHDIVIVKDSEAKLMLKHLTLQIL